MSDSSLLPRGNCSDCTNCTKAGNPGVLERFWEDQREFQLQVFSNFESLSYHEKIALTKEMLLHITSEFDELLSAIGTWKTHKLAKEELPKPSGIAEELVDITKFLVNIALIWGITPEQFVEKWAEKTVVNRHKFLQERALLSLRGKPVVVFDVDGVLNDLPEKWVAFVNARGGYNFSLADFLDLPKHVPHEEYVRLKHEFNENYSARVEFTDEARVVLSKVREKGVGVVLLTSRPTSEYKKFYYELISKLVGSGTPFDVLVDDREKGLRIMKDFPKVLFAVDDDPYYVADISSYGIKTFIYRRPYNVSFKHSYEIHELKEVLDKL